MKLILPVVMLLVGAGAGVGAGIFLKGDPKEPMAEEHAEKTKDDEKAKDAKTDDHDSHAKDVDAHDPESTDAEYVQLNNQFIVPVVNDDIVESLVVVSLGVELDPGQTEAVYTREPKLRDTLLQVLFDHANIGGFRGRFTDGNNMDILRKSLTEAARVVVGDAVRSIMITDIARQDV